MFPAIMGPEFTPTRTTNSQSRFRGKSSGRPPLPPEIAPVPELLVQPREAGGVVQGGPAGAVRVVGVGDGGPEGRHDHVALVFVEVAVVGQDDIGHLGEVDVEQGDELLGLEALGKGREVLQIGEEHRQLAPLPPGVDAVRLAHEQLDELGVHVVGENILDERPLAALADVVQPERADRRHREGERGDRHLDPKAEGDGEEGHRPLEEKPADDDRRHPPAEFYRRRHHEGGEDRDQNERGRVCGPAARPQEVSLQDVRERRRMEENARVGGGKGRRPQVEGPGRRRPDEDDLVPKDGRVESRRLARPAVEPGLENGPRPGRWRENSPGAARDSGGEGLPPE